jgi:hypothetical protein
LDFDFLRLGLAEGGQRDHEHCEGEQASDFHGGIIAESCSDCPTVERKLRPPVRPASSPGHARNMPRDMNSA